MKLLWVTFKRLERDLDIATWLEMSRELSKFGHTVDLILPRIREHRLREVTGVKLTLLPVPKFRLVFSFIFGFKVFLYLTSTIILKSPKIIIVDDLGYLFFLPLIILSRLGCITTKFVLDIRTLPVEVNDTILKFKERMSDFVYRSSKILVSGITVISPAMKDYLVRTYNMDNVNIGMWSSGISQSIFTKKCGDVSFEPPFNSNKYIILYHGILTKNRGLFESVQSLIHMPTIKSNVILLFLGSGQARDDLQTMINHLCLNDNVLIHDPVPYERIPDYINAVDVGLIPLPNTLGWQVSSPLKLLEYLVMGKPVIVSNIEAHRNVIGDSKYGIYLDSVTPQAIAKAIEYAYAHRVDLAKAGAEARKMILERYTWKFQADNLSRYLIALVK